MRIESSNVMMGSNRTYRSVAVDSVSYSGWGSRSADNAASTATTLPTAKDSMQNTVTKDHFTDGAGTKSFLDFWLQNNPRDKAFPIGEKARSEKSKEDTGDYDVQEYGSMKNLMLIMFGVDKEKTDWVAEFRKLLRQREEKLREYLSAQLGIPLGQRLAPTQSWGESFEETHYYEETEETEFYSSGKVVTADGRTIRFDVDVEMSRSFMEYANVKVDYGFAMQADPLVINLDSNVATVRDQKFLFDIDADGEVDNIALLSEMCGFLAYDKNEDGIINDGRELFGALTGDGFSELRAFDMDGNGWIDENDEIFNHLRIWTKDAKGNDKLVGLGIAGIGAIYLGNVATDFNLNQMENNENLATIRSTGVYLKESGEVGTIQHVDFTKTPLAK
ncbi:MAG: hypothetical protein K6G65_06570 [Lachnospiraceae bacterium]|nr:hypothetical protein [Lachnospiraceae bacterium]